MDACANPHMIADLYRSCIAGTIGTLPCVHCMVGSVDTDARSKQHMVASITFCVCINMISIIPDILLSCTNFKYLQKPAYMRTIILRQNRCMKSRTHVIRQKYRQYRIAPILTVFINFISTAWTSTCGIHPFIFTNWLTS